MKRTINKKIIIALLSALVAVCAGFALLLSRPAAQAKAEGTTETPTYSETWVIKENWDIINENSGAPIYWEITGKAGEVSFKQFYYINVSPAMFFIVNNTTGIGEKCIAQRISGGIASDGTTEPATYSFKNIEEKEIPYSEWKDTFGKITFYENTSAEKFSVLRTWLETNATLLSAVKPEPIKYTFTFKDGENVLYTLSVESGKAVNLAEHPEINESAAKTGYTFKGWATTQDGAVIVKNGYIPNVTADTTFYAVYSEGIEPTEPTNPDNPDVPEATEYKVVFLVDNLVAYTVAVKNGKAVSFADYPELSEKIKKDGYTFKGWKIEGQDEIYTDGIPVQNKTTVLVAVYEKKVLDIDGVSKAGSIVLTAAIGIVGVYFLFKLFGGKRRRR